MIKINLLGVAPPPPRTSAVGGPPAQKATMIIMFVGALVVCFGVVGVFYKIWSSQISDLNKQLQKEKIRQTELAVVKAQNQKYQQRLKDLETRINTIQALQSSRVGPVELMNDLGKIVDKTSDIYLYTMAPASGERLILKGQSGTVNSMANFLAYLQNSGNFDKVQLEQFYQDNVRERLTYKFTVSCEFKLPAPPGTTPTGGAAPGAPGAHEPGGRPGSAPGGMVGQPAQVQQRLKQGT